MPPPSKVPQNNLCATHRKMTRRSPRVRFYQYFAYQITGLLGKRKKKKKTKKKKKKIPISKSILSDIVWVFSINWYSLSLLWVFSINWQTLKRNKLRHTINYSTECQSLKRVSSAQKRGVIIVTKITAKSSRVNMKYLFGQNRHLAMKSCNNKET